MARLMACIGGVVVAVALAGCGGSQTTSSTAPATAPAASARPATATSTSMATRTPPAGASAATRTAAGAGAGGPVPPGFTGASLSFISPADGWVLGTAPCPHGPCTSVLHTTNGGASWAGVPAPRARLGEGAGAAAVSEIRFANARDGFAYAPGLWVTGNGARTWKRISDLGGTRHFEIVALEPTRDGTVYALAQPASGVGPPSVLLRAAPGSTAFTRVRTLPAVAGMGSDTLISAGDDAAVAINQTLYTFGPAQAATHRLPAGPSCNLAASSARALLAICGYHAAGGGMGSRSAYGTTDGGARWTRLPNPGIGDGYIGGDIGETTNGHAAIPTSNGAHAGLLVTTDSARAWHLAVSFRDQGEYFTDLGFESNRVGSVIYDPASSVTEDDKGELLRTTDGGATWHVVPY